MKICSCCGRKDGTVDRSMFDGMCADCTNRALNDESVAKKSKRKNELLKEYNL